MLRVYAKLDLTLAQPYPTPPLTTVLQVYAKLEEIQEMMPMHPRFEREAVEVHMTLSPPKS